MALMRAASCSLGLIIKGCNAASSLRIELWSKDNHCCHSTLPEMKTHFFHKCHQPIQTQSTLFTHVPSRPLCSQSGGGSRLTSHQMSEDEFGALADEVLEQLTDYLDQVAELEKCPSDYDVSCSQGVLTLHIDQRQGTFVINKQTPNKQIWLSSPVSGPKRYDFDGQDWVYAHTGQTLAHLLTTELRHCLQMEDIDLHHLFTTTAHS